MLAYLNINYQVDEERIYVPGFSNGAAFTYVFATARRNVIAAIMPIGRMLGSPKDSKDLKPIPAFPVAGKQDEIVKFKVQKEMMNFIKKTKKYSNKGIIIDKIITEYSSGNDMAFRTFIYNEEHKIP